MFSVKMTKYQIKIIQKEKKERRRKKEREKKVE